MILIKHLSAYNMLYGTGYGWATSRAPMWLSTPRQACRKPSASKSFHKELLPDNGLANPRLLSEWTFNLLIQNNCCIAHDMIFQEHQKGRVTMVHIRFCFDKSKHNCFLHKFKSANNPILNPVDYVIIIIHCADSLWVPLEELVGVYSPCTGPSHFIF